MCGAVDTSATDVPYNNDNTFPASQYLSDFYFLFWLGVMSDTTSSVINWRALMIPDTETSTSSRPGTVTRLDFDLDPIESAELEPGTVGQLWITTSGTLFNPGISCWSWVGTWAVLFELDASTSSTRMPCLERWDRAFGVRRP